MATIPRYQGLGIQYADLPRVATAAEQVRAQGFESLSRSLDRMSAYFQEQAVTEAKKKGLQYAIENPLTQEQVNAGLATGEGLKVEGGGKYFQESYMKAQSVMLSNELQLEGQRKIANVNAAIKAGKPVDLQQVQTDINDMIDGYAATVMALDPEQSVKLRAALSTAGNAMYEKAADHAVKVQIAQYKATVDASLQDLPAALEALYEKAGTLDPQTGKPINIDMAIEVLRQPYMDSIAVTGTDEQVKQFNKIVTESKEGALIAKLQDPNFVATPTDALKQLSDGNFGSMTGLWATLPQSSRDNVRTKVLKMFADEQSARDLEAKVEKQQNEEKARALGIELLNPNITPQREREVVAGLVAVGGMTPAQAASHFNEGSDSKGNIDLFLSLNDEIARGTLTSLGELTSFKSSLSDKEYLALGKAVTTTQGKMATRMLRTEAGIAENSFVTENQKENFKILNSLYLEEVAKTEKDSDGIEVLVTPTKAAERAITRFQTDRTANRLREKRDRIESNITRVLEGKGINMPNLPIEAIDFKQIPGLSDAEIDRLERQKRDYIKAGE